VFLGPTRKRQGREVAREKQSRVLLGGENTVLRSEVSAEQLIIASIYAPLRQEHISERDSISSMVVNERPVQCERFSRQEVRSTADYA